MQGGTGGLRPSQRSPPAPSEGRPCEDTGLAANPERVLSRKETLQNLDLGLLTFRTGRKPMWLI